MRYDLSHILVSRKNKDVIVDGNKKIKLFVENHPKSEIMNEALNMINKSSATMDKFKEILVSGDEKKIQIFLMIQILLL